MQDFADMAEAHEWTLRRLREMAGRLTEQAYLRASQAIAGPVYGDPDEAAQARWMLVFDRMARGLRLSIALEARLARERRWDADETLREALGEPCGPRSRRSAAPLAAGHAGSDWSSGGEAEPRESDREDADDDGLARTAPLAERVGRLKSIIEDAGAEAARLRVARAGERAVGAHRIRRPRWPDAEPAPEPSCEASGGAPAAIDAAEHDALAWRGSG